MDQHHSLFFYQTKFNILFEETDKCEKFSLACLRPIFLMRAERLAASGLKVLLFDPAGKPPRRFCAALQGHWRDFCVSFRHPEQSPNQQLFLRKQQAALVLLAAYVHGLNPYIVDNIGNDYGTFDVVLLFTNTARPVIAVKFQKIGMS